MSTPDTAWQRVYGFTARWEVGWVSPAQADATGDPGGATQHGITQATADRLGLGPVAALTPERVEAALREHYWHGPAIDTLWPISPAAALVTFDFGVQSGPPRAVSELQLEVGAHPDGKIGPRTRAMVLLYGGAKAASGLLLRRRAFLARWILRDPKRERLRKGLTNRMDALAHEIAALAHEIAALEREGVQP